MSTKRQSPRQTSLRTREPPPYDGRQLGESREAIAEDHGPKRELRSVIRVTT